jgi:hypothetical protein
VISVAGSTNHATNVTVQYSTMSEALTNGHQYGSLIRMNQNASVTYSHNLYSNNASRNPRPGSYDSTTLNFEFNNNVVYNWTDRAGYSGGSSEGLTEFVNMNYLGNYLIAGPSTVGNARRSIAFTRDASNSPIAITTYQSGNKIDSTAGATRDGVDSGWGMFANSDGTTTTPYPDSAKAASPFAYPMTNPDSADTAYGKVISSVGAFPYARTATDQRLINQVLTYTGTAALLAPNATEWNDILNAPMTTRPAGWDTDRDGMPDTWEIARGFNPGVADNNTPPPTGTPGWSITCNR